MLRPSTLRPPPTDLIDAPPEAPATAPAPPPRQAPPRRLRGVVGPIVLGAVVLALVALGVRAVGGGGDGRTGPLDTPHLKTRDIRDYVLLQGGRTVVVPDGVYTGGTVIAPHDDWLVLVARHRGGVVVNSALNLLAVQKVMFVGFTFHTYVTVRSSQNVVFWYADATNGPEHPNGTKPTFLWVGTDDRVGGANSRDVRVLGSYIHDVGDDGVQIGGADSGEIAGTSIARVSNKGINTAEWHNDVIQWTGGANGWDVHDNDLNGHVQVGSDFGPLHGVQLRNNWIHDGPNTGVMADGTSGRGVVQLSFAGDRIWGHGLGPVQQRGDAVVTGAWAGAPAAGSVNPAVAWRTANPYESFGAYVDSLRKQAAAAQ